MAKTKYNPLKAFREDPLAALKLATDSAPAPDPVDQVESGHQETSYATTSVATENRGTEEPHPVGAARSSASKSRAPIKPLSANLKTSRNTVYLYPEDLTKLRMLSGYVSTEHGIRANDSMLVRAALSLLDADVRLLHALKETESLDRRRRSRSD